MVNARENPQRTQHILIMRAMDVDKDEIAETLNCSRDTVDKTCADARVFHQSFQALDIMIEDLHRHIN